MEETERDDNTVMEPSTEVTVAAAEPEVEAAVESEPEPASEPVAEPEAAPEEQQPAVDVEDLIAEAEERGYKRGRNERIEELMAAPGTWEVATAPESRRATPGSESEVMILNNMRRSVWE